MVNLGRIYQKGIEVEQDYKKALDYYESASKQNNSYGFLYLGKLYENGLGVKQDYKLAKKFYELSSREGNSRALFKIGNFYFNGLGVDKNIKKSIDYYKASSYDGNPKASYYLGNLYSNGNILDADIELSIDYYKKCINAFNLKSKQIEIFNHRDKSISYYILNDKYQYLSMNNLRFIYLTKIKDQDDIENYKKAFYYLNKVSCVQFSYIQNNYGLFYQFYDNNDDHAKEYYENASKMKFALAKYNLGYLKEKGKDMINAINLYIEASSFENEPIYYQNKKYDDLRLEISKIFVICLTNLILSVHFFNNLTFDSSKKYFIRIFFKLQINRDLSKLFLILKFKRYFALIVFIRKNTNNSIISSFFR